MLSEDGSNRPYTGGSYHHAAGINKSLRPIVTRFALIDVKLIVF